MRRIARRRLRRIARRRWEEKGGAKEKRTGFSQGNEGCAREGKGVKGRECIPVACK